MKIVWTEERVEHLKKLWAEGCSASQCAAELNGPQYNGLPHISRNGAIGKVHRMGLSGRIKGAKPGAPKARKVTPHKATITIRRPNRVAAALADVPIDGEDLGGEAKPSGADLVDYISGHDRAIENDQRRTLNELTSETCHWPIGDPQMPDFFFCGGRALDGLPYCAHHSRIAYAPQVERRRQLRPRV